MLPILFFIYISGVLDAVKENNPEVTFLLFLDDLEIMSFGASVNEISQTVSTVASTVLYWGSIVQMR